jgi:hypothetical protein
MPSLNGWFRNESSIAKKLSEPSRRRDLQQTHVNLCQPMLRYCIDSIEENVCPFDEYSAIR